MDIKYVESLHKSLIKVFEEIAFTNLIPIEKIPDHCNGKDIVLAEIEYTKPKQGRLRLLSDLDYITEISADMLGENEPQPPETAVETFKEIMNMFVGVFMKEYFGENVESEFSIPKGLIVKYSESLCEGWEIIAFQDDFDNHVAIGIKK